MRFAFCLFGLVLLSLPTIAQQTRGITIQYKDREAADAPVAGTVNLYPKSYALVIGNDAYSNGWSRLSNAVKDAREVANALDDIGFDVTLKTNLSSRTFARTIEDWVIQKGRDPDARLFLWYAGHGHTSGGEGYLVPVDAPSAGGDDYDFRISALNMRRFGEWVRTARSKHIYAIFDSCFAGTVFDTVRAAPPPAITLKATRPVRQFLTSGSEDQVVSDDGRFRKIFIDALNGRRNADANRDGYLTASELGSFMSDSITNYTNTKQTPKFGKLNDPRYDEGDFIFAQVGDVAPALASTTASAKAPSAASIEIALWNSIKDTKDTEKLDAYLARVSSGELPGIFKAAAESALKSLSAPTTGYRPKPLTAEDMYQRGMALSYVDNAKSKYEWFQKAAKLGHVKAKRRIATAYIYGTYGSTNVEKGISLLKEHLEQGDMVAQYAMGSVYENGRGNRSVSYKKALEWYRKAADQGHTSAAHKIGLFYMRGYGVEKNLTLAKKWLKIAADKGHSYSASILKELN